MGRSGIFEEQISTAVKTDRKHKNDTAEITLLLLPILQSNEIKGNCIDY